MTHPMRHASRREFLRRSATLGALAGSPFAANLAAIGTAAAQNATDYKALVCIYLHGGNDHANTVVPRGSAYSAYASARGSLTLPQANLQPISLTAADGTQLGLHPAMARTKALLDQGRAALLANVGNLAHPVSKAQWNGGVPSVAVPFQLFSHSDQTSQWQTGIPDGVSRTGWLGRMGDLMASSNTSQTVSINMSIAGNNIMLAGDNVVQYQVTSGGAVKIYGLSNSYQGQPVPGLQTLITESRAHLLESELTRIARRSISAEGIVTSSIAGSQGLAAFPGGGLGAQLRMVARLIAARSGLGHRRQIFYVSLGGFDFHSNLLNDQGNRLTELDAALAQFYQTTVDMGVANSVTTFTASDFGRALQYNGDGSDHGWGGHHFIVGGAVRGGQLYGRWPRTALGAEEDSGHGRLIPTTATDQYAATLATWFGVSATNLRLVLPNIGRFATSNLGFLG